MEVDKLPEFPVHLASKIRFKDLSEESHEVTCVCSDTSNFHIDLGLLSEFHSYEVSFFMPHLLGKEVDIPPLQTLNVVVKDLKSEEEREGHKVTLEVKCDDHGRLEEDIVFENNKNEAVTLKVFAKIMANRLGTPSLKSGIKVINKCFDTMSDATEWQGFDE